MLESETKSIWGFDLGTTSIGWAIVDKATSLPIDAGVRILQPIDEEKSPAAERRVYRQARRQKERRDMRKKAIIAILQQHDMFPKASRQDRQSLQLGDDLKAFFAISPYKLRSEALERSLTKHELGRIFYHLARRRGFPFKESLDSEENAKTMSNATEAAKLGLIALPDTEALVGDATLGSALYRLHQSNTSPARVASLRRRYTKRTWYEEEFEAMWSKQATWQPDLLTPRLKEKIKHTLFFQRDLKSRCSFEPSKRVAPRYSLYFERFRFYQTLNNLKVNGERLSQQQRTILEKNSMYRAKDHTMEEVAKLWEVGLEEINYKPDKKIPACQNAHALSAIFGKKIWSALSSAQQQVRLEGIKHIKTAPDLTKKAELWQVPQKISKLIAFRNKLSKQYANLSHKVIKATLPYLERGFTYDVAISLASLARVFQAAGQTFTQGIEEEILAEVATYQAPKASRNRLGTYYAVGDSVIQQLKGYLKKRGLSLIRR